MQQRFNHCHRFLGTNKFFKAVFEVAFKKCVSRSLRMTDQEPEADIEPFVVELLFHVLRPVIQRSWGFSQRFRYTHAGC
jgi:hypothetical protein